MTLGQLEEAFDHDAEVAEETRVLGCPHCGGKLHRGDYPRKPRGVKLFSGSFLRLQCKSCAHAETRAGPIREGESRCHCGGEFRVLNEEVELPKKFGKRFSFTCSKSRKRKQGAPSCPRTTPPSWRFLGRKVYVAALVILCSAMHLGLSDERLAPLVGAVGGDLIRKWSRWWTETVPATECWRREAPGSFQVPLPDPSRLPVSALERFSGSLKEKLERFLDFIAPLTGGDKLVIHPKLRYRAVMLT
ncbi:MAG: hypothetical protein FWD64_08610 [Acidobacteriaceae bacterium]|nr:hypothetical protein [Acidobacteriaceae bacterium]